MNEWREELFSIQTSIEAGLVCDICEMPENRVLQIEKGELRQQWICLPCMLCMKKLFDKDSDLTKARARATASPSRGRGKS